jgi:Rod binding domain-containing protein
MNMSAIAGSLPATGMIDPSFGGVPNSPAAVEQAASQFESLFLSMLLKEMRNTLSEGMFGEENSDVYGGMFDMYLGQNIADSSTLGIKQMVTEAYERRQQQEAMHRLSAPGVNITA